MPLLPSLSRLMSRFRYPVSLPEEIASDLGVHVATRLPFEDFLAALAGAYVHSVKLRKFMERAEVERGFEHAQKKEVFKNSTLFSYDFACGWVVVNLHYDEGERLRRVYVQCPSCEKIDGFTLPLEAAFEEETVVA